MNYEQKLQEYVILRRKIKDAENKFKKMLSPMKQSLVELESDITAAAQEDGLTNVKTTAGTAYWSTHHNCKVANPSTFFDYCVENKAWDLLEKRASKKAVKGFVDEHKAPPPGIDFSSVQVFNLREGHTEEDTE